MIEIIFEGVDELSGRFLRLAGALEDDKVAFQADAGTLSAFYAHEFAEGGFPNAWVDVQPLTRKRRKFNPDAPPLTDSGSLGRLAANMDGFDEEEMRSESTLIAPGMLIHSISGADVHAHEAGYAPRNLPARPFFDVLGDVTPQIYENHEAWLISVIASMEF
jgi:phage gpG-like protein